jgi:hypothetical protein
LGGDRITLRLGRLLRRLSASAPEADKKTDVSLGPLRAQRRPNAPQQSPAATRSPTTAMTLKAGNEFISR